MTRTYEVVSSDDDGPGHLSSRDDLAGEDSSSDRDISGEGALLVCARERGRVESKGEGVPGEEKDGAMSGLSSEGEVG